MKQTRIYQCEDSIEGIFTAVYTAWASRYGHEFIRLQTVSEDTEGAIELFCDYVKVENDAVLAGKVADSIKKKISIDAFQMVVRAAKSADSKKANSIYHFLVRGFAMGKRVTDYLSDPYVQDIFDLSRKTGKEAHYYKEFLRFAESESKILIAKIEPKADIITMIAPHFADRLPMENFLIADVRRRIAAVHQAGKPWFMTKLSESETQNLLAMTEHKEDYESLWKTFFNSIAIKERENYQLQRNHVPLHYRKYMTEFIDNGNKKG